MSRGMNKAERVNEMIRLYLLRAYSDEDMAGRLNLKRRESVFKYRKELEEKGEWSFTQEERGKWKIERKSNLLAIKLNLHEALTLYLAARRVARQTHVATSHVVNAVEKLALALRQPMTERLVKTASQVAQQPIDPSRVKVLEDIAEGWSQRKKVRIHYEALSRYGEKVHIIQPYLIEPSIWSDSIYVIAQSDKLATPTPFSVARITRTYVTTEGFNVPDDFDEQALLRYAWGIWSSDEEPVTVRLKFTGHEAVKRVKQSIWHPLQKPLVDMEDGSCIWEARVSEWQEMVPWVRGWGADCEVLGPKALRTELEAEARRMARLYGVSEQKPMPKHWLLWAKTNRPKNTQLHLLICHLIDVGNVAQAMWERVFTGAFKQQIASALTPTPDEVGKMIAFLAALHDLGKASPNFQAHIKDKPALRAHYEEIVSAGFKPENTQSCAHGFVSTAALVELLQSELKMSRELAHPIAVAIGGHHGRWPTSNEWGELLGQAGGDEWKNARKQLVADLRHVFDPPIVSQASFNQETQNMLLIALSGITSVVDWLGSMENYFGYVDFVPDLEKYAADSHGIAEKVLEKEGWTKWQPPTDALIFSKQFENKTPRGAQPFIIELAEKLNAPSLVIIEDATGSGKTEAAWYLADHWTRTLGNRGVYVAMPTMATSNSLHDRVNIFLEARYPADKIKSILVHSQARFTDDVPERKMQSNDDADQMSKGSEVNALAWFEDNRKRSLLAPFGVGTVDQTFLSVLQTNHFFVRLFALGRKTVIFDEVHAYDTYMTEIFQTLLRWLRAMGSSAIILSATLPVATRQQLVKAYGGDAEKASNREWSSVVTWVSGSTTSQEKLPATSRKPIRTEWIGHTPAHIAERLRAELKDGGCVAVICNRVARVQEVYQAIKEAFKDSTLVPGEDLILFHARFPMKWRDDIEKRVEARTDKKSNRDRSFIVVATQVIEQSLDLDFDLIVTDLPPIDLLIQRVGRLHRHKEHDAIRPATLKDPRVLLVEPEDTGEVPRFGLDERVYERYVLLRTWLELKARERDNVITLELPAQTRELIEAVYAGEEEHKPDFSKFIPEQQQALDTAWQSMIDEDNKDRASARDKVIYDPNENIIKRRYFNFPEEDEQIQQSLKSLTRKQTMPTITVICLYDTAQGVALDENGSQVVTFTNKKPDNALTAKLMGCSVHLSGWKLFNHFVQLESESSWQEHSVLRHCRMAVFAKQDNTWIYPLGNGLVLELNHEYGIILREGITLQHED